MNMNGSNFEDDPIVDPVQLALFAQKLESENAATIEEGEQIEVHPSVDVSEAADSGSSTSTTSTAFQHPLPKRKKKTLAQLAEEANQNSNEGRLVCPECGCQDFRVTHTTPADGYRKRLRRCRHCGYPVNTVEFVLRD